MRGPTSSPSPPATSLVDGLPEAFLGSEFTIGLIAAFDDVVGSVGATLDDLEAYVDPRYAPDDFVRWLASWISPAIAARRDADHLRAHLDDLRRALLGRGTLDGVVAAVRACTGLDPDVRDSGGVVWSRRPQGPFPGRSAPLLEVDVRIAAEETDPDAVLDLVRFVVDDLRPAHVPAAVRRVPG